MELTYQDLLDRMIHMEMLAVPPMEGECGGNFSSYDRKSSYDAETDSYSQWGANHDCDGCIRMEGERLVAFEMEGPGVIWRIWSADPQEGNIRIYTEDKENEKMCMPFRKWFERYACGDGRVEWPSNFPELMPTLSRGRNRFIPIPFNRYCKITLDPDWGAFYHITYTKFPKDIKLPEYSLNLEIEAQTALAELDRKLHLRGRDAYQNLRMGEVKVEEFNIRCNTGEEKILFRGDTPLAICGVWLCRDEQKFNQKDLEKIRIQIYWDGDRNASVDCSMAAFFGVTGESSEYSSWAMAYTQKEYSTFWYMPCMAAEIKVINGNPYEIQMDFRIRYAELPQDNARQLMRFHAKQHGTEFAYLDRKRFEQGGDRWPDWPLLLCRGKGRFCGVHLAIDNRFGRPKAEPEEWWYGIAERKTIDWWWGEGDEKFFVDGEKFPSTFGTGSEDYVGYAWAAEPPHVLFDSAYAVQNAVPIDGNGMTSLLRFHICDSIPFQKSFEGFLEKYRDNGWAENAVCDFNVTPFWYMLHDGKQQDFYE